MEMKKEIKLLKALSKIFKEPKNKNEELVFDTVLNTKTGFLMSAMKVDAFQKYFKF